MRTPGQLELVEEEPRRLGGEIVLRIRQRGIGAGELDARGDEVDLERVAERDRRHQRFELVKAVGAAPENVEIEIDLGRSELFHFFSNTATTMTDKLILALDCGPRRRGASRLSCGCSSRTSASSR